MRLDRRLQKDRRDARVLNTGEVAIEFSDEGVDMSDWNERAEDGRSIDSPFSAVDEGVSLGVMTLTSWCVENWTRGEEDKGGSVVTSPGLKMGSEDEMRRDGRARAAFRDAR